MYKKYHTFTTSNNYLNKINNFLTYHNLPKIISLDELIVPNDDNLSIKTIYIKIVNGFLLKKSRNAKRKWIKDGSIFVITKTFDKYNTDVEINLLENGHILYKINLGSTCKLLKKFKDL